MANDAQQTKSLWLKRALVAVAAGYFLFELSQVVTRDAQEDFRTYFCATTTWLRGGNPYDLAEVSATAGREIKLPFVYPPVALWLFRPFAALQYHTAYFVYLALKLVGIAGLYCVWRRLFPQLARREWLLLATFVFGYRCALIRDLRAGNISVFEQVLLWGGFLLLLRGSSARGCGLVALSGLLKQTTVLFVALAPAFGRSQRSVLCVVGSAAAFGCVHLMSCWHAPGFFRSFVAAAASLDERGDLNPSALAVSRDVVEILGLPPATSWAGYGLWCALVAGIAFVVLVRRGAWRHPPVLVTTSVLTYVLLMPRMKDYSYLIALVPALQVIGVLSDRPRVQCALYLLLWATVLPYQCFFLTAGLFAVLFVRVCRGQVAPGVEEGDPPDGLDLVAVAGEAADARRPAAQYATR